MKSMKTLQLSGILAVLITAVLGIALVLGAIDTEQLKKTLVKSLLVVAIIALSCIVVVAIANANKN
jgi:predicted RND superfamily exporter protein